jgi:hypothetical protein
MVYRLSIGKRYMKFTPLDLYHGGKFIVNSTFPRLQQNKKEYPFRYSFWGKGFAAIRVQVLSG